MERTRKITTILTLAVAFCFVLVSVAHSTDTTAGRKWAKRNLENKNRAVSIPIWKITQDGTSVSVKWVDHAPNPRFAIYDPGTPEDETDDVVLDKETALVWERFPSTDMKIWDVAITYCYNIYLGDRKGWRLPTVEELASLVDPNQDPPTLPNGHPFIDVQSSTYWSSTTNAEIPSYARYVTFQNGYVSGGDKSNIYYVWCVRGGQGYDGY